MCANYFETIRLQARQLDDGITKLLERWKVPKALVGRFGECTAETNSHAETVWNNIKNTQVGLEEVLSEIQECKLQDSLTLAHVLLEAKQEYESLKEQCDSLDNVLAEYGYHYHEDYKLYP